MLELNQSRSEHSGQRGQRPQIRADGDNLASSRKEHLQYSVQLSLVFLAKAVILVLFCFVFSATCQWKGSLTIKKVAKVKKESNMGTVPAQLLLIRLTRQLLLHSKFAFVCFV